MGTTTETPLKRREDMTSKNEVAVTVWPWRKNNAPDPSAEATARRNAALRESVVACTVALILLFVFKKPWIAGVVFCIAGLVLLGGLFVEPIYRGFQKLGHGLALGVGVGLTWVLLVPFFYICFTFGRLVLLMQRKDPLHREFPTNEPTYWTAYPQVSGPESYSRQY